MKSKAATLTLMLLAVPLLQGCIALPSLVHVEKRNSNQNEEVLRRLDSIDSRLSRLEKENNRQP